MAARKEGALLLVMVLLMGCRGTPPPVARADSSEKTEKTPPAQPAPDPAAPDAQPAPAAPRGDEAVVVESGDEGESATPKTLVQAAHAERERRAAAGKPVAVITDKNLHQYAAKGQITVADPKKKETPPVAASAPAPAAAPSPTDPAVRDEQYWRGHALEIRLRWRAAADEIKRLEQRSTELRQRFYSENDSFVRDNQVKPEWDRVVDRLRQARADADSARVELAGFLEEGRRANALPGWLREGEDQEPPAEPEKKKQRLPAPQSIEPPVLGENNDERPPGE